MDNMRIYDRLGSFILPFYLKVGILDYPEDGSKHVYVMSKLHFNKKVKLPTSFEGTFSDHYILTSGIVDRVIKGFIS